MEPDVGSSLFLNEELVLFFSEELESASALGGAVRLLGPDGSPVELELRVDRDRVRLTPRIPVASELTDGSLAPGERYRLRVLGFPHPNALRSRDGRPLAQSLELDLSTADPDLGEPLFTDPDLGLLDPLVLEGANLQVGEVLRLSSTEPLDPRTFDDQPIGLELQTIDPLSGAAIRHPLRGELRSNTADGATIELWPLSPGGAGIPVQLDAGEYFLGLGSGLLEPALPWRDLGGQPVGLSWDAWHPKSISILAPQAAVDRSGLRIEFSGEERLIPNLPLGADGSALREDGRLALRFPAAAGLGGDGSVTLAAGEHAGQPALEAIELDLQSEAQVRWPADNLVLWRTQGSMRISGEALRRVQAADLQPNSGESTLSWRQRLALEDPERLVPGPEFEAGQSLSNFVARARKADHPWTLLISGGDVWIDGNLDLDGPLVIAAGGRVRITGDVRASEIWSNSPLPGQIEARELPLWLDPPLTNPLAAPLRFALTSGWYQTPNGSARWNAAEPSVHAGMGSVRLEFQGQSGWGGQSEVFGPVADPRFLEDYPRLRFTVWFELPAAGDAEQPWDPPYLDRLDLRWVGAEGG